MPAKLNIQLLKIGSSIVGKQLDINDEEQVKAFFAPLSDIDHIYIAAGSTKLGAVTEGKLEENMQAFDTRILGSLRVVRAAVYKIK